MSLAKVGILSIGDMGVGIAKLLIANGFPVSTNVTGRSQETVDRAKAANIAILDSDEELVRHCDIILSIVPPRDAVETAQRIVDALPAAKRPADRLPLYYADMNAVSPSTCKAIASLFKTPEPETNAQQDSGPESAVRLIDGCILGGPPHLRPAAALPPVTTATTSSSAGTIPADAWAPLSWYCPIMPMSGPHSLDVFPTLAETLSNRYIGDEIGSASGLKMCFSAMSKGYSAIAIQAFTTAHRLGVLSDLQWAMHALVPERLKQTEGALTEMAPKAYRWVREMEEISDTLSQEAGFAPDLFRGAAGVFKAVAEDTVLGQEKIGQRKRGRSAEDVAAAMAEGLEAKKKKQKTEE